MESLDPVTRAVVIRTIQKAAQGGAKKSIKALKAGVFEMKINYGPGYRIYFAEVDKNIILLLCGGDKKKQSADIKKAKNYWRDYGK